MTIPDRLWQLMGEMHPAVVHFPIALIAVAALVEIWGAVRGQKAPSGFSVFLATVGLLSAGVAIWFGWAQARLEHSDPFVGGGGESPSDGPIFFHRWLGVAAGVFVLAGVLAAMIAASSKSRAAGNLYRGALLVAAMLVMATGYFGGEITHGQGHVLAILFPEEPDPRSTPVVAVSSDPDPDPDSDPVPVPTGDSDDAPDVDPAPVEPAVKKVSFFREVRPILMERCVECHNANRKKGGLQIEPINLVMALPSHRAVITPGDGSDSELVKRMRLPADDSALMPKGGDPLPAGQIDLIAKWIDEGAVIDDPVDPGAVAAAGPDDRDDPPADDPADEPVAEEPATVAAQALPALEAPSAELVARLTERRVVALPVSVDSHLLNVNMSVARPPIGDDDLELLAGLEGNVLWLDLSRSEITDAGVARLSGMVRLERLRLDHTAVTDRAIASLAGLPSLRSLNLFGTGVTDAGLIPLARLDGLRKLYIAGTGVSDAGAENLGLLIPEIDVVGAAELLPVAEETTEGSGEATGEATGEAAEGG